MLRLLSALAVAGILLTITATQSLAIHSDWPPPISPVWPTEFTAEVHGTGPFPGGSHNGTWWYSWRRNKFRADYVNVANGTAANDVQLWDASNGRFYAWHSDKPGCIYYDMGGLSILRPDWAVHSGATYENRSIVDGKRCDLYHAKIVSAGQDFLLAQDPETNYPVAVFPPNQPTGGNHFSILEAGPLDDKVFDLDVSGCKQQQEDAFELWEPVLHAVVMA